MRFLAPILLVLLATNATPRGAFAAPSPQGVGATGEAGAREAFRQGLELMRLGECLVSPPGDRAVCQQAREQFDRAYSLWPSGLGALKNRAFIERSLGLYASAAASFAELEKQAQNEASGERRGWATMAHGEAARLGPSIPTLVVRVVDRRVRVELDARALAPGELGVPLKLDPGRHVVVVHSPGRAPETLELVLAPATHREVSLPAWSPLPPKVDPNLASRPGRGSLWPLVVMGMGGALTVTGLGLGAAAWEEKSGCNPDGTCDADRLERGRSLARASTITTVAGLATVAGGGLWLVLTPRRPSSALGATPWVFAGGGGVLACTRF